MRQEPVRITVISSLATLLLGCASTPAVTSTAVATGKTAVAAAPALSQTASAAKGASSLPATSTNLEDQIRAAMAIRLHGDVAQATRALAQLVLAAPDDPRVLGEYGKVLVQQGRADDALAFLKRAIEIKASDWTLYSALGVAYDQIDDRKNAKVAYDRALLLHPGDPAVLNNYAVSRMLAKDYDGAQRLLMQAQAAGGDLPKIAGNLQLLAQLRAAKTPAAAEIKSTVAGTEPQKGIVSNASDEAAEARSAPAVVMQRVPADTPSAATQNASRPAPQFAASSPATPEKPISPGHAAGAAPRAISPIGGVKGSDPVSDHTAEVAAKSANQTQPRTRASNSGQTTTAWGGMTAAKPARSISAAKASASAGQKKSAVTAQKDKSLALPALRTAD